MVNKEYFCLLLTYNAHIAVKKFCKLVVQLTDILHTSLHYCTLQQFNPFLTTPAKTGHLIILLCVMPHDLTCQRSSSGGERVNRACLLTLSLPHHQKPATLVFHSV